MNQEEKHEAAGNIRRQKRLMLKITCWSHFFPRHTVQVKDLALDKKSMKSRIKRRSMKLLETSEDKRD